MAGFIHLKGGVDKYRFERYFSFTWFSDNRNAEETMNKWVVLVTYLVISLVILMISDRLTGYKKAYSERHNMLCRIAHETTYMIYGIGIFVIVLIWFA